MDVSAGATFLFYRKEGADDRRSSPRTVLAAHRPPVVISNLDTKRPYKPYNSPAHRRRADPAASPDSEMNSMSDIRESRPVEEPMGIVISQGSRAESTPRFAAYVWSQVGDVSVVVAEPRAA
jgi:hypothetical protein